MLYVDAEAETDEGATGSADNPYATIQAAVNAAPNNKSWQTSIIVRKGTYNKSEGSPGYRVRIWNKTPETSADWWYKRLRIVAEEGPGKTFIVGARGEGSDGTGSGAMGCCYVEIPSLVQGFTLTGGYKATGGAAAGGNSAGNAHYADCIITNNVGGETIAYQAQFTRCRIADNVVKTGTSAKCGDVTGGTATSPAVLLASEVVHSSASASGSYAIGRAVRVVFSTVSGACDGLSNWKNYYIGSIVPGGFAVNTTVGAQYCFAEGSALSGTTTGCSNGKSKCVSYHKGDFRLRDDSPCLGMVTFDVERYRSYATLDMDGNPLDLRSLAGNTAGAHQKWSVHYEPRGVMLIIH